MALVRLIFIDFLENAQVYQQDILRILMNFRLPSGIDYSTSLSSRPPRYWELEISSKTPGIDYRSIFFVPVYAKPLVRKFVIS